jgi:hypothetical protein
LQCGRNGGNKKTRVTEWFEQKSRCVVPGSWSTNRLILLTGHEYLAMDGLRFRAIGGPDPTISGREAAQQTEDGVQLNVLFEKSNGERLTGEADR